MLSYIKRERVERFANARRQALLPAVPGPRSRAGHSPQRRGQLVGVVVAVIERVEGLAVGVTAGVARAATEPAVAGSIGVMEDLFPLPHEGGFRGPAQLDDPEVSGGGGIDDLQ